MRPKGSKNKKQYSRVSKLVGILTKDVLTREYEICGSMQKMADKLNVNVDSIYKYMQLHEIPYEPYYSGIYDCNHNIFGEDTERSFYLAGFIAADGSVQYTKHSGLLKIALSKKDQSHLEKIKILLESNHPIMNFLVKPSKLVKTSNEDAELSIASKIISKDLQRFNIVPNKTLIYTFPQWLIGHPLVNHFMRGYFDGDGSIYHCRAGKGQTVKQKSFSIIGNEQFIQDYRNILVKNCDINKTKINARLNINTNNTIYAAIYSGNNNIQKIYDFLYKDATIYLDRKRDIFIEKLSPLELYRPRTNKNITTSNNSA